MKLEVDARTNTWFDIILTHTPTDAVFDGFLEENCGEWYVCTVGCNFARKIGRRKSWSTALKDAIDLIYEELAKGEDLK